MSKATISPLDAGMGLDRETPKPEEIRRQLRNVLASPVFHGSKRCQRFLEYVCVESLSGGVGTLKERAIAIEVFGRHPQSDLGEDTIVRVGAREVRKRLAQYYVTAEGAAAEVRIDLPPGGYAPEFRYVSGQKEEEAAAPAEVVPPATSPEALAPIPVPAPALSIPQHRWQRRSLAVVVAGVALAALAVSAASRWGAVNPNAALFQEFWDPVLQSPDPLLIAVAHPIVYHPSARAIQMSEDRQPPQDPPRQRPLQVPAKLLDGSDLVPVLNQYVGFGDMIAATQVSSMLGRKSKDVPIRMANSVGFEDLRQAPTLLIGSVTNYWTMELQQSWRFRFQYKPGQRTTIVDTTSSKLWSIHAVDDGSAPEDYILICRIRNSFTGGLTLAAAGLKQFGTEAAGRLLTDPDQLGVILRKLPPGWENKNVQVVLHAQVIRNTPAQPDLVDWHVW